MGEKMKSVHVLKREDIYGGCDCGGCFNTEWDTLGAFSTRKLAEEEIDRREKTARKHNNSFNRDLFWIDELTLDEVTYS
jgi:hypothetical protein